MTFANAGVNLFYVPNLPFLTTPDQQQNSISNLEIPYPLLDFYLK